MMDRKAMVNLAALFLSAVSMPAVVGQDAAAAQVEPVIFLLEVKVMQVPSISGKEVTVWASEPKIGSLSSTKLVTSPKIRTVESMLGGLSWGITLGKEDKISLLPSRSKDGRYGLQADLSYWEGGKQYAQKADVQLNAKEWVQIIGKSRTRVVTIRVVPEPAP
jgi:hypothetical protein